MTSPQPPLKRGTQPSVDAHGLTPADAGTGCRYTDDSTPDAAGQDELTQIARIIGGAVYGEPDNLSRATEAAEEILAAGFHRTQGDDYEAGYAEGFHHGRSTPAEHLEPPSVRESIGRIASIESRRADAAEAKLARIEKEAARLVNHGKLGKQSDLYRIINNKED